MKCDLDGAPLERQTEQTWHYDESGLNNVYLEGIDVYACPVCGDRSPAIPHIIKTHEAIARRICLQPYPLTGVEMRFLRKHEGLRAVDWAWLLGVDKSTVSRWESGEQPIGAQSDMLARYVWLSRQPEEDLARDAMGQVIARAISEPGPRQDIRIRCGRTPDTDPDADNSESQAEFL